MMHNHLLEELEQVAQELARHKDYGEEAAEINQRLIELKPGNGAAYLRLARCALAQRNFSQAAQLCRQALVHSPASLPARASLERVEAEVKQAQAANVITSYRQALNRGLAEKKADRAALAVAFLWRAVELSEKDQELVDSSNGLAGSYRAKGEPADLDLAEKIYQGVLELAPNDTVALSGLASVKRDKDKVGEARRLYQEVLAAYPASPQTQGGLVGVIQDQDQGDGSGSRRGWYAKAYAFECWRNRQAPHASSQL